MALRVVVQRCREAQVSVAGETIGRIGRGFMLLVGITHTDTEQDAAWMADKIATLRIIEDEQGKMNLALCDVGGAVLSVSQFTLYGDCAKGRRPNFMAAARPDAAERLYDHFNALLRSRGLDVQTGQFGAMMDVQLINEGPVTLVIDSP